MEKITYLGDRAFYKKAIKIALPVMMQLLIQSLVSLVDNFMVSGLGDIKMSGVNITGQILFVFNVLLNTVCAAGGIFLTQFSGAGDRQGMKQSFCFKTITAGCAILLYLFVCWIIPRPSLNLLVIGNTQAESILDQAQPYMEIMGFMGIPMAISTIIASSYREIGEVKAPLLISVIATLVNTFLNWVLIYGNLGAPALEVRGAAYATVIARTVEMILYLGLIARGKPAFMIRVRNLLHVDYALFRRILKKGALVLFSEMLWVISETVSTALYNGRGGADVVSGMAASFAIADLFFVSFSGISTATGVLVGHSLGKGELENAKKQKRWLLSGSVLFGAAMSMAGFLTMLLIPLVFGNLSASAQGMCRDMVFWMALLMPLWVYNSTQFAVSKAGGDTMMGLLMDGGTTIFLIFPMMFIMALCTDVGPVTMYVAVKLVDFIKVAIAYWWLKKEKWVRNLAQTTIA